MKPFAKGILKPEPCSLLGLTCLLSFFIWFEAPANRLPYGVSTFGAEYGNLAESLVTGQGFSNPFLADTGPSAWMPPFLVCIYALVFWLFGVKTIASGYTFLGLKVLALVLSIYQLMLISKELPMRFRPAFLTPLGLLAFLGHQASLLQSIMDQAFIMLLSALTLRCLFELGRETPKTWHLLFAFLLPLSSPNLTLGFIFLVILTNFKAKRHQRHHLKCLLGVFFAILIWAARNTIILGAPVPSKSNLWFEFYLSNVLAPQGHLSTQIMHRAHPFDGRTNAAAELKIMGEVEFDKHYRRICLNYIKLHPDEFLRKLGGRAFSALIQLRPIDNILKSGVPLKAHDLRVLNDQGFIERYFWSPNEYSWLLSELPPHYSQAIFAKLELEDPERAAFSLADNQRKLQKTMSAFSLWGCAYSLLPSLAILVGFFRFGPRNLIHGQGTILYLLFLAPYILVSHSERYQTSALIFQIWLLWLACSYIPKERPRSQSRQENPFVFPVAFIGILMSALLWLTHRNGIAFPVTSFGWEYGNTAASLASGQGFANPFTLDTGPTAWVPPVSVSIFALAFTIFGIKTPSSAICLLALKVLGLSWAVYNLAWAGRKIHSTSSSQWLICLFGFALLGQNAWLSRELMDQWIYILFFTLVIRAQIQLVKGEVRWWHLLLSFLLPLTTPPLALGFILVTCLRKADWRSKFQVLGPLFLALALWSLRNYCVFGALIPSKSNISYELYQANVLAQDGYLDSQVLSRTHPHGGDTENYQLVRELGELEFCREFQARFWEFARTHPKELLKNLQSRASAAFWCIRPLAKHYPAKLSLHTDDMELLSQKLYISGLSGYQQQYKWNITAIPLSKAYSLLSELDFQEPERVYLSLSLAHRELNDVLKSKSQVLWGICYAFVPFLFLLIGLYRLGWKDLIFRDAVLLYIVFLTPYVLISHADRYQTCTLAIQVWIIWLVLCGPPRLEGDLKKCD